MPDRVDQGKFVTFSACEAGGIAIPGAGQSGRHHVKRMEIKSGEQVVNVGTTSCACGGHVAGYVNVTGRHLWDGYPGGRH